VKELNYNQRRFGKVSTEILRVQLKADYVLDPRGPRRASYRGGDVFSSLVQDAIGYRTQTFSQNFFYKNLTET